MNLASMSSRSVAKAAAIAVGVPLALFGGFTIISHAVWHRSKMGTVNEILNRIYSSKEKYSDSIQFDNYLHERAELNEDHYQMPLLAQPKVSVAEDELLGSQVFHLNRRGLNDRAVIYLHGGAFMCRPKTEHWNFFDRIARKTRAELIVPMYPLAPVHTYADAYELLDALYEQTIEKYGVDNTIIMGDSSGGGLAAGFVEQLIAEGRPQPKCLILVSPLVDCSLSNPDIERYAAHDPVIGLLGQRKSCSLWARGTDIHDWHVSPINGEVRGMTKLIMFVGTRELLYPDAKLFYDRAHAAGVDATIHIGRGLNHNYPMYASPEATRAMDQIVQAITEDA